MTEKETKEKKVSEKPSSFEVPKHIKLEFAIIGVVLILAAGLVMGSVWFPNSTAEVVIGDEPANASMDTGALSTKVLDLFILDE